MNMADFAEHERVLDELLRLLGSGTLIPGNYFPPAHVLSHQLCTPISVVQGAQEELINRGMLVEQNHSMLVARARIRRDTRKMNSISDAMAEKGHTVTSRVIHMDFCEASKEVASVLQLPLGARVFRLVRLRMLDGEPLLLEHSYLHAERFPGVEAYDYNVESLYRVLREQYSTIPMQQDLEFELESPSEAEQRLLGLDSESLLLTLLGHTRDQNGRPMEYSISKSVANRFLYESVAELGGSSLETPPPAGFRKRQGAME